MKRLILLCVAVTTFLVASLAVPGGVARATAPVTTVSGVNAPISLSTSNQWGGGERPSISADGRFVAFESLVGTLDPRDKNGLRDVYVRDRDADADGVYDEPDAVVTTLVSVAADGSDANGDSLFADVSDDGRFVSFTSHASDIVAGDTNAELDVFVHDRDADGDRVFDEPAESRTVRLSVAADGRELAYGMQSGVAGSISADGRFVLMEASGVSACEHFVACPALLVRDRDADGDGIYDETGPGESATARVDVSSSGQPGGVMHADLRSVASISADGRFVVFSSEAPILVEGDTNSAPDVFIRDRDVDRDGIYDEANPANAAESQTRTSRVSVATDGGQVTSGSFDPDLSDSGRWIVFEGNGVGTRPLRGVVLHDRDVDSDGVFDEAGAIATSVVRETGSEPSIAGNGATLGWGWDISAHPDGFNTFYLDRDTDRDGVFDEAGATRLALASSTPYCTDPYAQSTNVSVSSDGRWVAYGSSAQASNEVDGNGSGVDVFAHDVRHVWVSVESKAIAEGATSRVEPVDVVRRGDPLRSFSVHVQAGSGTATWGSDYVSADQDIAFSAGEVTKQYTGITVYGDAAVEPDETFGVETLVSGRGVCLEQNGVETIVNDDVAPLVIAWFPQGSGIAATTSIQATFDQPVTSSTIVLTKGTKSVAGTTTYDAISRTVTFKPDRSLSAGTTYTATATGTNVSGTATKSWSFTTAAKGRR